MVLRETGATFARPYVPNYCPSVSTALRLHPQLANHAEAAPNSPDLVVLLEYRGRVENAPNVDLRGCGLMAENWVPTPKEYFYYAKQASPIPE